MNVATLANLLRETAEHHHPYETSAPEHNWWDWYAAYLNARLEGSSPEEATQAAGVYMEGVLGFAKRRRPAPARAVEGPRSPELNRRPAARSRGQRRPFDRLQPCRSPTASSAMTCLPSATSTL
jgi:hypothetical protein